MRFEKREIDRVWGSRDAFSGKSTTVFVDNLPFQIRKIWVYNLFSRFGKIRNLFIPNKRSKISGQSFAFVRYLRLEDAETAISNTNDSWYWNHKLVVKFPRFLKEEDFKGPQRSSLSNFSNKSARWSQKNNENQVPNFSHKSNHWNQNSHFQPFRGREVQYQLHEKKRPQYQQIFTKEKRGKEVWRRKGIVETSKQGEQRNAKTDENPADVHMGSIKIQAVGNGWLPRSAIAKMSKLVSTKDLEYIFEKEGNLKVQIKAIGGRFVMITFSDVAVRDSIIKDRWLTNWFEEIKPWEGEQAMEERFVWLACYGMPLNAWSYLTFKEIGEKWGNFLQVDEDTLKESSYVKAKILVATNQFHKLEGFADLIIDKVNYTVRVLEEDSFRFIKQSLIDSSWDSAMEKKDPLEKDDNKAVYKDEVEIIGDVGSKCGVQDGTLENSISDEVENSNGASVPLQDNESDSSPLGIENSTVGSEMVADSLGKPLMGGQPQDAISNCLLNQESELMENCIMDVGIGKERLNDKEGKAMVLDQEEHDCINTDVAINEQEEHFDHFDANQIPIQATIKGIKGKRNRKTIDEILGYTRVNTGDTKGKRNKKKCVVLRSAVASAALSASISSGEIKNRNRILLDEAQAIWAVDKLFGISYDGDENEVISKIAEMEALNKARVHDHH